MKLATIVRDDRNLISVNIHMSHNIERLHRNPAVSIDIREIAYDTSKGMTSTDLQEMNATNEINQTQQNVSTLRQQKGYVHEDDLPVCPVQLAKLTEQDFVSALTMGTYDFDPDNDDDDVRYNAESIRLKLRTDAQQKSFFDQTGQSSDPKAFDADSPPSCPRRRSTLQDLMSETSISTFVTQTKPNGRGKEIATKQISKLTCLTENSDENTKTTEPVLCLTSIQIDDKGVVEPPKCPRRRSTLSSLARVSFLERQKLQEQMGNSIMSSCTLDFDFDESFVNSDEYDNDDDDNDNHESNENSSNIRSKSNERTRSGNCPVVPRRRSTLKKNNLTES